MTQGKNRYEMPTADDAPLPVEARRRVGPMGAAGREVAENVAAATEAQVEARRRNAADAKEFRAAREAGRVLTDLALDDVYLDGLPRDRLDLDAVAAADEMEELKASIRERGQREPIEVYLDGDGRHQLKKGWRRLTALQALWRETGDPRFATVVARVRAAELDRVGLYIDMVEENAIRQDLSFAEMAAVAIKAVSDPEAGLGSVDEAVARLYASLQRTKRSYIRQFAFLLEKVGGSLRWPQAVGRDLGVEAARSLRDRPDLVAELVARLGAADSADAQNNALAWVAVARASGDAPQRRSRSSEERRKYEFHHQAVKVTARAGECRIKGATDFAAVPRDRLEAAVAAFLAKLSG